MKRILIVTLFAAIAAFGLSRPAGAQAIPSVRGLKAFTPQAHYMSLPGYLRWQYYVQNDKWISFAEAKQLAAQ